MPDVPGGHWPAIIAPTLGDGVTSCVNGPSGLRKHCPELKVVNRPGGTLVIWPNGVEAKIFGAHTPEDVERLRSGGNRCFSAGTLIATQRGEIPVEQVTTEDLALTRQGYLPIDRAGLISATAPLWKLVLSNGRTIRCTPDHKFLINGQWVEAQHIRPGYTMTACHVLTAENTSKSGKLPTDPFQKAARSIIEIETKKTIDFLTYSAFLERRTGNCTTQSEGPTGTARAVRQQQPNELPWNTPALNVATSFSPSGPPSVAGSQAAEKLPEQRLRGANSSAKPAVSGSSPEGETPPIVLSSAAIDGTEPVYCIRVPGPYELVAEGVVARNCMVWAEELAAWRYIQECWNHMRYGLRLGPWPHVIISTTPKPKQLIKNLVKDPTIVVTKASTDENPHLHPDVKRALFEDYGGTREGRQELYAEILEDIPGALWDWDMIDNNRIDVAQLPEWLSRIAVGVDPAVTAGGDETGIIVCGVLNPWEYDRSLRDVAHRRHGFVLCDYSIQGGPRAWAREVVTAYHDWDSNIVVPEINNGGELVSYTIHQLDGNIPMAGPDGKGIHASRGKRQRAEPISVLYQQGLVHHVGELPELEEQMVSWDSIEPDDSWSPDRMDALVWSLTELMVRPKILQQRRMHDTRLHGRR
jgi:phage terminase large subunit-like protein